MPCSRTTPTASQPAAPATTAATPSAPQAIPAKVALIAFEQAVFSTNEGQVAVQTVQKKYEPKKAQIDALSNEVDTLKKQAQAAPATSSEEERAARPLLHLLSRTGDPVPNRPHLPPELIKMAGKIAVVYSST